MWINKIQLHNFRAFKNEFEMELAKNITCIAGHNGIGKSTILAVLSNCGELKMKGATKLDGGSFRGDFADIVIGNEQFDKIGDKAKIFFSDLPSNNEENNYVPELEFRATFQKSDTKNNEKRYRLIPKKIPKVRKSEAKVAWPTIYLGLSRLYPVGESKAASTKKLPDKIMNELLEIHSSLLSMNYGENATMKSIGITEISGKKKTGVETSSYASTSNSAGQDNIGQIILSVLSFQELKNTLGEDYKGGLLVIDEIDATLHPAVQFRLLDFLLTKSEELDLQIVFTTHSISLLEHMTKQYSKSKIKTCYLRKREESIDIKENPSVLLLRNDLSDTYSEYNRPKEKIKLLTEDEVARWFFKLLLQHCNKEDDFDFHILDIDIGWQHIIKLLLSDPSSFKNFIVILDPDIRKSNNENWLEDKTRGTIFYEHDTISSSIFRLPASKECPEYVEKIMWEYISNLPDEAPFYKQELIEENNWQKHIVLKNGPLLGKKYSKMKDEKVKIKNWFNDNRAYIEIAVSYWIKDNKETVDDFLNNLLQAYKYKQNKLEN